MPDTAQTFDVAVGVLEKTVEDEPEPFKVVIAGQSPSDQRFDRWGDLMIAARDGNDIAYDLLLRELDIWLLRYYRRRLPVCAAEDAAQEVLLAVHKRRYTYEASGPFGPWLATIARFKWMDRLRQQYRDPVVGLEEDFCVEDHGAAATSAIVVNDLIGRLKPSQATVIRLVKIYGASIEEASDATGQSASLVKVNIHRGLKKLASFISCEEVTA